MKIRIPSKKVCEKFHLTYELEGARKAVRILTKYYRIPEMKITLNGRRVMRACEADYFEGVACFTKRGLKKRNILHELYHHIIYYKNIEIPEKKEERKANSFAIAVIRKV
jgi:hypothetical protein